MDEAFVAAFLGHWAETEGARATLINVSENHSYRIDRSDGARFILRLHRPGYQTAASIRSELEWIAALRHDTALPVPRPLPGRDGELLQLVHTGGQAARHAVLFAFEAGAMPTPDTDLGGLFETLGGFAAVAHAHAASFRPSPGFKRQVWTAGSILDADGLWGDWRRGPAVDATFRPVLERLDTALRADLEAYGHGADRFGLIHADMRLGNLLVDGERVTLIDFDDCGFGWFMYDFAAAISFYEDHPRAGEWRHRWLAGYRAHRHLSDADVAIIDTVVMMRRMALLAWIGSHGETPLAQMHAPGFAQATANLAEAYLRRGR